MATDHDFKIKNGLQVENGFLLIGKEAFSSSDGYMGIKTSNMSGVNDYMMISGTGDNGTYVSAKSGASVYIRGGGNASAHQLRISSSNAQFYGNLQIDGNLTVNGTTLTVDTTNLQVQDNNITLNYGTGNTVSTANGAGITIQDAMAENHDATILWDTSNDRFNFSDPVNIDIVGPNNTPSADALTVAGYGIIGNRSANVYITNSNSSGGVQIGVGGAHNANPKLTVSSSAATFTVPVTSTYFLASGGDSTPAGTTFSNVFKGSNQRTVYFDSGDGSAISTWYGSGNTPFAAIDANNGVLKLYVNDTGGNWHQKIGMTSSGVTHYGSVTSIGIINKIDSGSYATFEADGNTNEWKWLRLSTNGTTAWDIAARNDDLSNALQFRPGGGPTNRTSMSTAGDWTFGGRITVGDTAEGQKVVLNFDTGGNMILGNDGSYGATGNGRYTTLGFGGNTNGVNRIFAHNGTADGMYFAAATGQGFRWRPNGSGTDEMELSSSGLLTLGGGEVRIGQDGTYGNYATIGFGGTSNGSNRIFAHKSGGDGLFLTSATSRHIYFRTNGSANETFRMSATGDFQMGSSNTTVIDASRNLTNIGTITNSGKISSSIGSNATYSRPLLEITSSATPTQIKITTNILYSGTGASTHAHSVRISGFQYGSAQMADLQIGWHVYNNEFYNRSVTSSGSWAPTVTLAVENNKVVIHLASPGYWPKLYVESMYNAYGGAGQASGWSWTDAAISADSNTPNQTVPYKFDYGNGVLKAGGTTVIDSSRNLTNIGTISSGAITSSGSITATKLIDADNSNAVLDPNGASVLEGSLLSKGHSSGDNWMPYTDGNFYIRAPITIFDNNVRFADGSGVLEVSGDSSSNHYLEGDGQIRIRPNGTTVNKIVLDSSYLNAPAYQVGGTTVIDSSRNISGVQGTFTDRVILGTEIGSRQKSLSIDNNDNSSPLAAKTNYDTVFSILPWSGGETYIASGIYYDDGSWVHASSNTTNCLFKLDGDGVTWYSSNNSSGSWNVASDVDLWDNTGTWVGEVDTSSTIDSSSGFRVNGTTVIDNGRKLTNITGGYFTGNVGIRANNPDSALAVRGTGTGASQKNTISFGSSGWGNPAATNAALDGGVKLALFEGSTQKVQIGMDGNARLWLSSTGSGTEGIDFYTGSSDTAAPSLRMRIDKNGVVGINKTSMDSSYRLDIAGHIKMNNNHIHYANEVHFNSNTRFLDSTNAELKLRAGNASVGLRFQHSGGDSTRGYVWGNNEGGNSIGFLDSGGNWGVRHINDSGTEFRSDNSTLQAAIGSDLVSGGYGGMVLYSAKNGYVGYSLNNRAVFMHNNSTTTGIYNDVSDEWYARFIQDGSAELYHNGHRTLFTQASGAIVDSVSGQSTSQIKFTTNGTTRGYVYGNTSSNFGLLDAGGNWAIRHIQNSGTEFRQGNNITAEIGAGRVSSDYGSMVVKDYKNGWAGYNIDNNWVFMSSGDANSGIYNDVNNQWGLLCRQQAEVELYHNGSVKMETTSSGIDVTGNVKHDGLTMTSGTDIDQLYTVTDSLTITTSWQNTSINYNDLSTGTYIIQVYVHDYGNGGAHYNEYYSGMMSWYAGTTNSTEFDELALHRAGHAPNDKIIFLRTLRTASNASPNVVLQIRGNYTRTAAANYVFKLRRMI